MKILVLSDTHLKSGTIPDCVNRHMKDHDMIIHAGDFASFEAYKAFENTGKLKAVYGNTDPYEVRKTLSKTLKFEVEGIRIGVVHEGALSVNDTTAIRYKALEMGVDILIFGHIHHPVYEESDVVLLCPGSPTNPRMSDPMMAELNIENGKLKVSFIEVEGSSCGYVAFSRDLNREK
ncbi:putative phosphoesterase [Methanohalophilus levihalophilus]|uniref:metallophosphoesterase n=1 Tax=Methanohalophilus levihalophilus TaxID=1431282 RepID=UPI001AEB556C|nr:metallophosphoesterase [Methanohalophilus levihalophilus]MBP2030908.1 putative phosphoesterase [Methanohalophilus levihalophilus]